MQIADATATAMRLLFSGDGALWEIVGVSLAVSGAALLLATPLSLAAAYALSENDFFGRRALIAALQSLLSFPTVVVGLVLYMLLSRQGALGAWGLLFTPKAMALGQALIAFPVLTVFSLSALQKNDPLLLETVRTFGAGRMRAMWWTFREARFGLVAALLAGFGRVISEVGCALMVGGNIAHYTRGITTAIALETGKGSFAEGIALGVVLVAMALAASAFLTILQGGGKWRD
ncbi:MAG: ABC transporter permease [Gammaproteobacteria bacterium]